MKKMFVYFLFSVFFFGSPVFASEDMEMLKNELKKMSSTMEALQNKIEAMEKENEEKNEEVQYLSNRVDKTELHTVTDKISLGVELRSEAHSIYYNDMQVAPSSLIQGFFTPYASGGFNGGTLTEIQNRIAGMKAAGMVPPTEKYDAENEFLPTSKFNLNMKAKVNNNLSFDGRLAAYKVWGDSSGVKTNTGSLGDVTLDGNTSSVPHGDTISLERAYFLYSKTLMKFLSVFLWVDDRPQTAPPWNMGKIAWKLDHLFLPLLTGSLMELL